MRGVACDPRKLSEGEPRKDVPASDVGARMRASWVDRRWDEARVNGELRRIVTRASQDLRAAAKLNRCGPRTAAFALAIGRGPRATELCGVG